MANMLLPAATFRSPTAVADKSDVRDDNIYSALVVQHTGTGQAHVFTVPQGQAIPKMNGSSTASTQPHQGNYSDTTTNLTQAGQLGAGIGDASVKSIGITFEQAAFTLTTSVPRAFGMTQFEVADVLAKCAFELKIAGKRQIIGPVWAYPSMGAAAGSLAATGTQATPSIANNGVPGAGKRLKVPLPLARTDTLDGVFSVATGASLAFSTTTGEGQPSLVWFNLGVLVKGDVR